MCHFALRLIVALLTFVVGVTVSSLWNFKRTVILDRQAAPVTVLVAAPTQVEPLPPQRACSWWIAPGGVLNGKAISKPQPAYPPVAKAARAQGTVTVEIIVDENGKVINAQAVSGHPLLRAAAEAAARQAKISATFMGGLPVKVSGTLSYNFVLE